MKPLIKLPFAKRVVGYYRGFIYYFTSVLFHVYCAYYEIILIVKHFIKKICALPLVLWALIPQYITINQNVWEIILF